MTHLLESILNGVGLFLGPLMVVALIASALALVQRLCDLGHRRFSHVHIPKRWAPELISRARKTIPLRLFQVRPVGSSNKDLYGNEGVGATGHSHGSGVIRLRSSRLPRTTVSDELGP